MQFWYVFSSGDKNSKKRKIEVVIMVGYLKVDRSRGDNETSRYRARTYQRRGLQYDLSRMTDDGCPNYRRVDYGLAKGDLSTVSITAASENENTSLDNQVLRMLSEGCPNYQ